MQNYELRITKEEMGKRQEWMGIAGSLLLPAAAFAALSAVRNVRGKSITGSAHKKTPPGGPDGVWNDDRISGTICGDGNHRECLPATDRCQAGG